MRVTIVIVGVVLLLAGIASGAQSVIYRCETEGATTYSDQPCATGAAPHEVDDSRVTIYTPPPVAKAAASKPATALTKVKRSKSERPPDPAKHKGVCDKLERSLRDIRSKMRSGYGAEQGERLRQRQRQLDQRRRDERCAR